MKSDSWVYHSKEEWSEERKEWGYLVEVVLRPDVASRHTETHFVWVSAISLDAAEREALAQVRAGQTRAATPKEQRLYGVSLPGWKPFTGGRGD